MSRDFCARWRKISKQIQYKDVRQSLCGVALILTRSAIIVNQHRTHFYILTERFFQLANVTFLSKI